MGQAEGRWPFVDVILHMTGRLAHCIISSHFSSLGLFIAESFSSVMVSLSETTSKISGQKRISVHDITIVDLSAQLQFLHVDQTLR